MVGHRVPSGWLVPPDAVPTAQSPALTAAVDKPGWRKTTITRLGDTALILLAGAGIPLAWQATLLGYLPPTPLARTHWPLALLMALACGGCLSRWLANHYAVRLTSRMGLLLAGTWLSINAICWWLRASPIMAPAVTLCYLGTIALPGWWLVMPFTQPGTGRRLTVTGVLLLPVAAWFCLMRGTGPDGAGRPIVVCASWSVADFVRSRDTTPDRDPNSHEFGDPVDAASDDFPGFRGGEMAGTIGGVRLARDWSVRPPRLAWREAAGGGWGGFAVAAGRAFSHEQRGEQETVVCRELLTGRELWAGGDEVRFTSATTGDGPRDTPAVAHGAVYSLGATGMLVCRDAKTGERRWSTKVLEDQRASNLFHGLSGSPLVVGELVVVSAGGPHGHSLAAYHCDTGKLCWSGGDDPAGYGSPQMCTLAGVQQILIFNRPGVAAHDPRTGRVLWSLPWTNSQESNCSQPVPISDDRVLLSTGYGKGSVLIGLSRTAGGGWSAVPRWTSRALKTKFSTAVISGDYAYGLDEGVLVCLDLADGSRRWRAGRHGHGQLLLVGNLLLVQAESGEVVLVEAAPDGYREHGRLPGLAGKTWNYPALASRWLLVRNDREAACYELPLE